MEKLFENLLPPPGGLEGLRRKLEAPASRSFSRHWIPIPLAATAAVVVLGLGMLSYRVLPPEQHPEQKYGIFQRYMEAPPNEAVSLLPRDDADLRLVQQPTGNPAITLYWIEDEGV